MLSLGIFLNDRSKIDWKKNKIKEFQLLAGGTATLAQITGLKKSFISGNICQKREDYVMSDEKFYRNFRHLHEYFKLKKKLVMTINNGFDNSVVDCFDSFAHVIDFLSKNILFLMDNMAELSIHDDMELPSGFKYDTEVFKSIDLMPIINVLLISNELTFKINRISNEIDSKSYKYSLGVDFIYEIVCSKNAGRYGFYLSRELAEKEIKKCVEVLDFKESDLQVRELSISDDLVPEFILI